jgi:hypothetical protein
MASTTSDEPTRIANEADRGTYRGVIGVVHCPKVRCAVVGSLAVCENGVGGEALGIRPEAIGRRVRAAVGVSIPTDPNRIDHIHQANPRRQANRPRNVPRRYRGGQS